MDLGTVRAIAEDCGYIESVHHSSEGILIVEIPDTGPSVSIWYQTRAVGVSVSHPRRGRLMSFFFHVDERLLQLILVRPWYNEAMGYTEAASPAVTKIESEEAALRKQIGLLELEERDIGQEKAVLKKRLQELPKSSSRKPGAAGGGDVSEISKMERRRQELAEEIEYLEKQKAQLHGISRKRDSYNASPRSERSDRYTHGPIAAEETQSNRPGRAREQAADPVSPIEAPLGEAEEVADFRSTKSIYLDRSISSVQRSLPSRYKGNRCLYSFASEAYQEEFARAWADKPVQSVGLSVGYIIVYEDGTVAWWDIPAALDKKFRDEETVLPPVKLATLGPGGNYFLKFTNGKMEWVAKNSFQSAIRLGIDEGGLSVDRVALGPDASWIILWSDKTASYEGIPPELSAVIVDTKEQGLSLREVNLGPNGEWFVILSDHSVQANNLPTGLHKALNHIKQEGGRVRSIVFGENSSFYVRYWDGKSY